MNDRRDQHLFPVAREPASFWERSGLSRRGERALDLALLALVVVFTAGWAYSIRTAVASDETPSFGRRLTESPLSDRSAPPAAFVLDAAVRGIAEKVEWRGESGALRVRILEPGDTIALPDSLGNGAAAALAPHDSGAVRPAHAPTGGVTRPGAGVWDVVAQAGRAAERVPGLTVLVPVPMSQKHGARMGQYLLGTWPFEGGRKARPGYETPSGAIRVDSDDVDIPISEHFTLGEFLTKGQNDVWPKYVVIQARNLDKLELTIQELEKMGHPVEHVGVISGFRTPNYNANGGDPSGRGALSRHMYGDAADVYIDNDRSGCMDDLNGDGRVDKDDARVLAEAANRVEQQHPNLVGGIGTYAPNPGSHCGFVHIDSRGYRARW